MQWADRAAPRSVRRAGSRARVVLWGLFMGAAAAVLAPVGPGAFVPLKMAIASASSVGNQVYVAVVIDFGGGSAPPTIVKCVPVAPNNHDADALAAAVGSGNVAYSNSGLLCAIDGYPANGVQNCGQSVGSGVYDYWSYWHGSTGSWVYANNGPAEQSVSSPPGDVAGPAIPDGRTREQQRSPTFHHGVVRDDLPGSLDHGHRPGPAPSRPRRRRRRCRRHRQRQERVRASPRSQRRPGRWGQDRGPAPRPRRPPRRGRRRRQPVAGAEDGTSGSGGTSGRGHGSSGTHRIAVTRVASSNSGGGSSGNLLPVVLVAAVVAALGGLAFFRWRRRPAEE